MECDHDNGMDSVILIQGKLDNKLCWFFGCIHCQEFVKLPATQEALNGRN